MQQQRQIGASGIEIVPFVLGGNVFGYTADAKASFAILDAFVDLGGSAIDTADSYSSWAPGHQGGESENVIGAWLKQSGKRNKVVIGTKVGMWDKQPGIGPGNIISACEGSLRRLGVETIDLYWLHRDDLKTPAEDYVGALETLVRDGKVRALGASNFEPDRFREAIAEAKRRGLRFDAQQPEYNLMQRGIEAELLPLCAAEGVSVLPYFALASGYLTGKYRSEADKAKSVRGGRMDSYMNGKGPAVLAALDAVAARLGASAAQIALAWIMTKPAIGGPIASATNVAQLRELMGALELTLAPEDVAELDRASA